MKWDVIIGDEEKLVKASAPAGETWDETEKWEDLTDDHHSDKL